MTKLGATLAALLLGAGTASAQGPLTKARESAQKAAAASNAQTAAMQKPEAQKPETQKAAAAKAAPPTAPKPTAQSQAPKAVPPQKTAAPANAKLPTTTVKPGTQLAVARTDTASPPPTIYREVFEYSRDGRRDPFNSLLTTNELRPTITDLRLTGILFDHTGRNSVATLRDQTNGTQYRVSVGSTLGRMRVTAIRVLTIVFTIDEFGTTRKDSLTLRDSTKARAK